MSTVELHAPVVGATPAARVARRLAALSPGILALGYPFLLRAFHLGVSRRSSALGISVATLCLVAALASPVYALIVASRLSRDDRPSPFTLRARRLAYLGVASAPLFVLLGVVLGLVRAPVRDTTLWVAGWLIALVVVGLTRDDDGSAVVPTPTPNPTPVPTVTRLRVAHGMMAALLTAFVLFHLSNHLAGLLGPEAHARVMKMGRTIYRSRAIEPVFIACLLFQIASGLRLAWRWSAPTADGYRVVQIASGVYLGAFLLTHLNSALVSARTVHRIDTDWAWASGAPTGLITDAWNIRLLPHYAFSVLFALVHLASGLRLVLLAHGARAALTNRLWRASLLASAAVAATILGALLGVRI